jgi:hypothetical protein
MSRRPFPWPAGQPKSLRADLYTKLDLPARVGGQIGIVSSQYEGLASGRDVTFTTAQLVSFYPLGTEHSSLPPALGVAESWVLSGDDTLSPVV